MEDNPLEKGWKLATSKDYFSRLKIDPNKQGSASLDLVHLGVGAALSEWERAEESMARLFDHLVRTPGSYSTQAAAKAYGSIESSSARVNMVRAAAEAFYGQSFSHPGIKKPLGFLLKAHSEASHRRNEISHGIALNMTLNSKPLGTFLVAPEYHTDRNTPWLEMKSGDDWSSVTRSLYRYNHDDLLQIAGKFGQLSFAIMHYLFDTQPFTAPDGQVTPHPKNLVRIMIAEVEAKKKQVEQKEARQNSRTGKKT